MWCYHSSTTPRSPYSHGRAVTAKPDSSSARGIDLNERAPRVVAAQDDAIVSDADAVIGQPLPERRDVVVVGYGDVHLPKPARGRAGSGSGRAPGVHGDVVVVAAGGDEQRRSEVAHDLEPEGVHIEVAGRADVA